MEALRLCLEAALHKVGGAPAGTSPALGSRPLRVTEDPTAEVTAEGHQVHLGLPTTDGTYRFLLYRESAASIVWFLDHMAAAEKDTKWKGISRDPPAVYEHGTPALPTALLVGRFP